MGQAALCVCFAQNIFYFFHVIHLQKNSINKAYKENSRAKGTAALKRDPPFGEVKLLLPEEPGLVIHLLTVSFLHCLSC